MTIKFKSKQSSEMFKTTDLVMAQAPGGYRRTTSKLQNEHVSAKGQFPCKLIFKLNIKLCMVNMQAI